MPENVPVSFRETSGRSAGLTMSYRSNTERVLWPVTVIAKRSDTPARTRLRTAALRRSCRNRPEFSTYIALIWAFSAVACWLATPGRTVDYYADALARSG